MCIRDSLTGSYQDSFARGELYNDDPRLGDARLCGTTASLCGIERFGFEGNEEGVARGIRYDITLHAFMLSQSGIPVIYSGDEIGQLNDYSYKNDSEKAADSRYLHRGDFNWDLAENRHRPETVQGKLFPVLDKLEKARKGHSVFNSDVAFRTIDTWDSSILALVRENDEEKFIGIYNFCLLYTSYQQPLHHQELQQTVLPEFLLHFQGSRFLSASGIQQHRCR